MSVLTEMLYIDWDSDRTNYLNSKDPRDFIDVLKVILDWGRIEIEVEENRDGGVVTFEKWVHYGVEGKWLMWYGKVWDTEKMESRFE